MSPQGDDLRRLTRPYRRRSAAAASWQVGSTFACYLLFWAVLPRALAVSPWLGILLAVPCMGVMVRLFVLFHDCTHRSLFPSPRVNAIIGSLLGIVCLTPFYAWRRSHLLHHRVSGMIDERRLDRDLYTMTVREYRSARPLVRLGYRIFRSPVALFVLIPALLLVFDHRISRASQSARERWSVRGTNLGILLMSVAMSFWVGTRIYLVFYCSMCLAGMGVGVWLFYVQHQFDAAYWRAEGEWDFGEAALRGSSFYKLPRVLQWFTGNIGFHHVHHLEPSIPNYRLQACHEENAPLQAVRTVTLRESIACLQVNLWDEDARAPVSFAQVS